MEKNEEKSKKKMKPWIKGTIIGGILGFILGVVLPFVSPPIGVEPLVIPAGAIPAFLILTLMSEILGPSYTMPIMKPIVNWLGYSFILVLINGVGIGIVGIIVGYVLSKLQFRSKNGGE